VVAQRSDDPLDAWVRLGAAAYGLIVEDRIAAIVYFTPSAAGEQLEPGEGPSVLDCGYYLVDINAPWDHECIAVGTDLVWETVCEDASREYLGQRNRRQEA
jgi:hypothetical protein